MRQTTVTATLDATYTDSDIAMGTVTVVGYITRTWTLSDNCGNTTVQYQTIWVSAGASDFRCGTGHSLLQWVNGQFHN